MAEDYYKTLEVSREATQDEILKSYRRLARKFHPDLNPNDKQAKEKFQKIQAAFDVLKDPEKRDMYDRYGSSFEQFAGAGGRRGPQPGPEAFDFSDLFGGGRGFEGGGGGFGDFFSQFRNADFGQQRGPQKPAKGQDVQSSVSIPFRTAVTGGTVSLSLARGSGKQDTIEVKIPPGIEDGKKIRLRGQGESSMPNVPPGDLLIVINVEPDRVYERKGRDLYLKLPLSLAEAALGTKADVPTPSGTVTLRIPPGSSSGAKLRVKGHGIPAHGNEPAGDLYAEVQIKLPADLDDADRQAIREIDERHPQQLRQDLRW